MCGILVYNRPPENFEFLQTEVRNRGPDYSGCVCSNGFVLESSVLSLCLPFTPQPVADDRGVLCYNGQLYSACGQDTELFRNAVARNVDAVHEFEGEFAFVYLDRGTQKIYFGRDRGGRRSLCFLHDKQSGQLVVSSIGGAGFAECDGGGIVYVYDLDTHELEQHAAPLPFDFEISRQVHGVDPDSGAAALRTALREAVARRCTRPPGERIAVLFSGGLDCTLVAALLDEVLDAGVQVDLLNVAFENRRTNSLYGTPDRVLARRSYQCLRERSARFTLLEIDVPYEETQAHKERVQQLMLPTATVMDLSIAVAFYFATRPRAGDPKILLSGLGADELFAGYSRHTSAAADPARLANELAFDFLRLPHRNLGRDDRVVASWGRELRYPFLDGEVVKLAMGLPLDLKTDGVTTKRVLRAVAAQMGLDTVVHEKKRAIQFGARSAKMDPGSGNSRGHHSL